MVMSGESELRNQIEKLLTAEQAHRSFDAAVANFPSSLVGRTPGGVPHSAWQIVEHIRIAQRDILDFCTEGAYRELTWPGEYWPASSAPPDDTAWKESIAAVKRDRVRLIELLHDPSIDLNGHVPNGHGQTYLREFLLVADHNAYHVGQLILLRKLLGCWPPG